MLSYVSSVLTSHLSDTQRSKIHPFIPSTSRWRVWDERIPGANPRHEDTISYVWNPKSFGMAHNCTT